MASSRESDTEIPDFSQPYQASLIDLIVASNRRPRRDRLAQHPIWTEKAVRYVNSLGRCIPLPPEILMRIVRENVEIESGSRCISMCMLLCCRDWCDVAEFMLWRDILLAGNSRVKSFLACVDRSIGSTNQNISRLRSLQVALHPRNTLCARLCGKLSLFQNLRHLSVTITDPNDTSGPFLAKYADFEWRLLLLKLPTTLESLELVARDNDVLDPRTSIFFIIQKAMRHLRSLRIVATDYESQHWQVPLMQPWAETYPLLEQFSILIEHSSDCDEPYCINPDILQGAAYLVDQARRAGQFPKLRVANFSVYESSRRSPKFRVKYLCLIKTASVFDMVRSKVLRYPLLQVRHANSQDGEIIEKTIFWTQCYVKCKGLKGPAQIVSHQGWERAPLSRNQKMEGLCLATAIGTLQDLQDAWEGSQWTVYQDIFSKTTAPLALASSHGLWKRSANTASYVENMEKVTDEAARNFLEEQKTNPDGALLPMIEPLDRCPWCARGCHCIYHNHSHSRSWSR